MKDIDKFLSSIFEGITDKDDSFNPFKRTKSFNDHVRGAAGFAAGAVNGAKTRFQQKKQVAQDNNKKLPTMRAIGSGVSGAFRGAVKGAKSAYASKDGLLKGVGAAINDTTDASEAAFSTYGKGLREKMGIRENYEQKLGKAREIQNGIKSSGLLKESEVTIDALTGEKAKHLEADAYSAAFSADISAKMANADNRKEEALAAARVYNRLKNAYDHNEKINGKTITSDMVVKAEGDMNRAKNLQSKADKVLDDTLKMPSNKAELEKYNLYSMVKDDEKAKNSMFEPVSDDDIKKARGQEVYSTYDRNGKVHEFSTAEEKVKFEAYDYYRNPYEHERTVKEETNAIINNSNLTQEQKVEKLNRLNEEAQKINKVYEEDGWKKIDGAWHSKDGEILKPKEVYVTYDRNGKIQEFNTADEKVKYEAYGQYGNPSEHEKIAKNETKAIINNTDLTQEQKVEKLKRLNEETQKINKVYEKDGWKKIDGEWYSKKERETADNSDPNNLDQKFSDLMDKVNGLGKLNDEQKNEAKIKLDKQQQKLEKYYKSQGWFKDSDGNWHKE